MNLKMSCADFSFPLLSYVQTLDLIAMLGFQAVDIGMFAGHHHMNPGAMLKNIKSSATELLEKTHDRGLEISDVFLIAGDFRTLACNDPDVSVREKSRDLFLRAIEFAQYCRSPHFTILPGVGWANADSDSMIRSSKELAWRVEQAARAGICLAVEPHVGSIVETPGDALKLVEMTPGLTMTLDYGHFTFKGFSDDEIEPLVGHASHFHARCARKFRLQAPFSENTIDFQRLIRALQRTAYAGYFALEYVWVEWERCNEVDNLSETILLRDHLKSIVG
jgi:sugar phosphate isomerase/epimerase